MIWFAMGISMPISTQYVLLNTPHYIVKGFLLYVNINAFLQSYTHTILYLIKAQKIAILLWREIKQICINRINLSKKEKKYKLREWKESTADWLQEGWVNIHIIEHRVCKVYNAVRIPNSNMYSGKKDAEAKLGIGDFADGTLDMIYHTANVIYLWLLSLVSWYICNL